MENTKLISIIGREYGDLPYFLSVKCEKEKKRVLCIDNSYKHDLFESLDRPDDEVDHVERGTTVFMRNKTVDVAVIEDVFGKFDVVICYFGINPDYEIIEVSDRVLLQTDYDPFHIERTQKYIDLSIIQDFCNVGEENENFEILFRDKANPKIGEDIIAAMHNIKEPERELILNYNERDYSAVINFYYNGSQNTEGLSKEYNNVLDFLLHDLLGNKKAGLMISQLKKKNRREEA